MRIAIAVTGALALALSAPVLAQGQGNGQGKGNGNGNAAGQAKPGKANGNGLTPEQLVDGCLDLIGPLEVDDEVRQELITEASVKGDLAFNGDQEETEDRIIHMLQLIVSTREFQFG